MRRCLTLSLLVRSTLVIACLSAGGLVWSAAYSGDPQPPPRRPRQFDINEASLAEAAQQAGALVRLRILIEISPGHRARQERITLAMQADEPADLLNALAAAYGLRWVYTDKAAEVALVDKQAYQAVPNGLRAALADAAPTAAREVLAASPVTRLLAVQAPLRRLGDADLAGLEAACINGPIPLDQVGAGVKAPLLDYLEARSALKLAAACDGFSQRLRENRACRFHYGTNPRGSRQFSFQIGPDRWISCHPE